MYIYIYIEVIARFYRLAWHLTTTTGSWCLFPGAPEVFHTVGHCTFNTDNTTKLHLIPDPAAPGDRENRRGEEGQKQKCCHPKGTTYW